MIKRFLNITDLVSLLNARAEFPGAHILAGGTDLVVRMKNDMIDPETILSIRGLDELRGIEKEKSSTIIGSLASHTDLEESSLIRTGHFPLYSAAREVGSPQIRNMGTIGGNIANASPSGDTIPALMVMDASIRLMSKDGDRTVAIRKFFKGPGKTVMKKNEIIHSITIPNGYSDKNSGFIKAGLRKALSIAVVSVAWCIKGKELTFAFGGAAPTVTTMILKGTETREQIKSAVLKSISPIDDLRATAGFREQVIINLVEDVCGKLK